MEDVEVSFADTMRDSARQSESNMLKKIFSNETDIKVDAF